MISGKDGSGDLFQKAKASGFRLFVQHQTAFACTQGLDMARTLLFHIPPNLVRKLFVFLFLLVDDEEASLPGGALRGPCGCASGLRLLASALLSHAMQDAGHAARTS